MNNPTSQNHYQLDVQFSGASGPIYISEAFSDLRSWAGMKQPPRSGPAPHGASQGSDSQEKGTE